MRVLLALVAMCAVARAQQMPCEPCARGDDTLRQWGPAGEKLRQSVTTLVQIDIRDLEIEQRQHLLLQAQAGDLIRELRPQIAALSEEQLKDVAAAMCNAPDGDCVGVTWWTLRCMAGQCTVRPEEIQHEMVRPYDPPGLPSCDPIANKTKSPARGIGFEWATGWQDDASPTDHRAWSLGFEARTRLPKRAGLVARLDRSTGRDKAIDADRDGRDDLGTGPVTRVSVMAGPSYAFAVAHDRDVVRFLQLDLLGGYQWTLSQDSEDGFVAGADLSYTLAVARIGMRYTQGFGDAQESRAVLAHVGFLVGSAPSYEYGSSCNRPSRTPTKIALALDIPLFGYGVSSKLDYIVPGFGIEGLYHVHTFFDAFVRGDILDSPGSGRDRSIYQTLLAGGRIDLTGGKREGGGTRTGMFTTLGAGYAWAATTEPTTAGQGPVVDASIGWGGQGDDGAAYLRVHGRFGLLPDNQDMRAIFLSGGLELRLDRSKWKDRN